jgi:hypothetical protein
VSSDELGPRLNKNRAAFQRAALPISGKRNFQINESCEARGTAGTGPHFVVFSVPPCLSGEKFCLNQLSHLVTNLGGNDLASVRLTPQQALHKLGCLIKCDLGRHWSFQRIDHCFNHYGTACC